MPVLSIEGLACRRGGRLVVAGVNAALDAGGVLLVTGRNGSGKSTLLRTLALLAPPAAGRLVWQGRDVTRDREAWHRAIGWLGHADALKPELSVRETLRLGLDLAGNGVTADTQMRSEQAVARFDLAALLDRAARHLSAGQRRRVALARLAAADAPLWLMDEPTVALDGPSTTAVVDAITAHRAGGGMAIIATHLELPLAGAALLDLDSLPRAGMGEAADLVEIAAQ
jgi:heme exporter protein A